MAAARKQYASKSTTYDTTAEGQMAIGVRWDWADGQTTEIKFSEFPKAIVAEALANGFKQKLGDKSNTSSGANTVTQSRQAWTELRDQLRAGTWNLRGGPKAPKAPPITPDLILDALCELKPDQTREALAAKLEGLSADIKSALLAPDGAVIRTAERIRAERRAQSATSADDVLAMFDDQDDDEEESTNE